MSKSKWQRLRQTKTITQHAGHLQIHQPTNIDSSMTVASDLRINGCLYVNGIEIDPFVAQSNFDTIYNNLSSRGYTLYDIENAIEFVIRMKRGTL